MRGLSAQLVATLFIVSVFLGPSPTLCNERKSAIAVPPGDIEEIMSLDSPDIELSGAVWQAWPVLLATEKGLSEVARSEIGYVMLRADIREGLSALGADLGDFHTYEETVEHLSRLKSDYPELVEVHTIGQTVQGRDILAALISGA
ncbi:hypothetical protein J7M28_13940, partial [bacterium]|nr:hypothetical protein [bacterium]